MSQLSILTQCVDVVYVGDVIVSVVLPYIVLDRDDMNWSCRCTWRSVRRRCSSLSGGGAVVMAAPLLTDPSGGQQGGHGQWRLILLPVSTGHLKLTFKFEHAHYYFHV